MVATNFVASKLPRVVVYMEPELKAAGEKLAKKQRRSLSSLICVLLEAAAKQDEDVREELERVNTTSINREKQS
ncbi:hypothetical protein [Microseira wollei]|uniref:CopG-like ribbon-helix-helix domain-containing protein n=1 Tax=Microseira wollei NIES-4236 TaxID=2530354 RepID=A0AAV3XK75_9CYAN|nr:hypothetical protein [Microseira wollei]GET43322.1 hypothetical protein MiSe_81440 [Microseira wollei NIES-4236]